MKKKSTVLWIPLRPYSSWIGEGISCTLEEIIKRDLHTLIVVALQPHIAAIKGNLGEKNKGILFYPIPQIGITFKSYHGIFPNRLLKILRSPEFLFNYFSFFIMNIVYFLMIKLSKKSNKVWCPTFAVLFATSNFEKTKIVNFWDGFVFEYFGFESIRLPLHIRITNFLSSADKIITQSYHNKRYLTTVFDIPFEKIVVIPNLNPEVRSQLSYSIFDQIKRERFKILKFWKANPDIKTNKIAGLQHTEHLSALSRLISESSKNTFIILTSTQVRPYKGYDKLLTNLTRFSIENQDIELRLITTGKISTEILGQLDIETKSWAIANTFQISRVQKYNHALLYTFSDLVMHPSLAEGGHGVYPLFEAASVSTPCLMNVGRHTREIAHNYSNINNNIVNFSNYSEFSKCLSKVIVDEKFRKTLLDNVLMIKNNVECSTQKYISILHHEGN